MKREGIKFEFEEKSLKYTEKLFIFFYEDKKLLKPHISCGFWLICLLIYLYA